MNNTSAFSGAEAASAENLRLLRGWLDDPLYVLPGEGIFADRVRALGVRVEHLSIPNLGKTWNPQVGLRQLSQLRRYRRDLLEILVRERREVLHANSVRTAIACAGTRLPRGVPFIWTMSDVVRRSRLNSLILRRALREADLIIAVARSCRASLIDAGGDPGKIMLIYNGLDHTEYRVQPDERMALRRELTKGLDGPVVIMVGQMAEWKGWHVWAQAMRRVAAVAPSATFVWVGDAIDEQQRSYRDRAISEARAAAGERFRYLGFRSDVPRLLGASDILVHASVEPEPLSLVIQEGQAAGLAVIATDSAIGPGLGTVEVVTPGETGLLVPRGSAEALAEAVIGLLRDTERRSLLAARGQASCRERFSTDRRKLQLEEAYAHALDQAKMRSVGAGLSSGSVPSGEHPLR